MMDQPITEIRLKFERRIADYEAEILRLKEENYRQRKLLDAIYKPEVRIYKSDLQQFLVSEDKIPSVKQEWSPSLNQGKPEPPHIKEEEEELWSSQEEEQLEGLEEKVDITKLSFPHVPVRRENDEEKAQSSQCHQSQTEEKREAELPASTSTEQMKPESDGEDFGPIEPASNLNQDGDLQPTSDGYLSSDCCESETEDNDDDGNKTREPHSGLDTTENNEISNERSAENKPFSCSVCGKGFYICHIGSLLTFSFLAWYGGLSEANQSKLWKVTTLRSKLYEQWCSGLQLLYKQWAVSKAGKIARDKTHDLSTCLKSLPCGRRYHVPNFKNDRGRDGFIPSAIPRLHKHKYFVPIPSYLSLAPEYLDLLL
ncbi:uncharacterized protein LOC130115253 [Lampris incognitus]|uniref:uncharacterized protein LOC130115253 n=1 Tax=Lampris incognitus TaxID=2546036 RepID=UPI0024B5A278|nr:uncharacterized protein LOC130115253 [Lampris incognitus]